MNPADPASADPTVVNEGDESSATDASEKDAALLEQLLFELRATIVGQNRLLERSHSLPPWLLRPRYRRALGAHHGR